MRTSSVTLARLTLAAPDDQAQPRARPSGAGLRLRHRVAPSYGRERLYRSTAVLPLRRDQAHAAHPLHRAHHVHTAADGPPAIAGPFHEREALQPHRLAEWRGVAAEPSPVQLKTEQLQPVAQPHEADELAAPWMAVPFGTEAAIESPEAERIEPRDHDLPLRHQHALGLA